MPDHANPEKSAQDAVEGTTEGGQDRRDHRVTTIFRPALIDTKGFTGFCLVRNLSSGGMRATVYVNLEGDLPVAVHIGSGAVVTGRTVWSEGDDVGIEFDEKVDVDALLAQFGKGFGDEQVARAPRLSIQTTANLESENRSLTVDVRDISQRGLKIAANFVSPDEEVWITIAGLERRKAAVKWVRAGSAGLNFLVPLSFDDLAKWAIDQQTR